MWGCLIAVGYVTILDIYIKIAPYLHLALLQLHGLIKQLLTQILISVGRHQFISRRICRWTLKQLVALTRSRIIPPSPCITRSRVVATAAASVAGTLSNPPSLHLLSSAYFPCSSFCNVGLVHCSPSVVFTLVPYTPISPPLLLPSLKYQIHSPLRILPLNLVRDIVITFSLRPA